MCSNTSVLPPRKQRKSHLLSVVYQDLVHDSSRRRTFRDKLGKRRKRQGRMVKPSRNLLAENTPGNFGCTRDVLKTHVFKEKERHKEQPPFLEPQETIHTDARSNIFLANYNFESRTPPKIMPKKLCSSKRIRYTSTFSKVEQQD